MCIQKVWLLLLMLYLSLASVVQAAELPSEDEEIVSTEGDTLLETKSIPQQKFPTRKWGVWRKSKPIFTPAPADTSPTEPIAPAMAAAEEEKNSHEVFIATLMKESKLGRNNFVAIQEYPKNKIYFIRLLSQSILFKKSDVDYPKLKNHPFLIAVGNLLFDFSLSQENLAASFKKGIENHEPLVFATGTYMEKQIAKDPNWPKDTEPFLVYWGDKFSAARLLKIPGEERLQFSDCFISHVWIRSTNQLISCKDFPVEEGKQTPDLTFAYDFLALMAACGKINEAFYLLPQ